MLLKFSNTLLSLENFYLNFLRITNNKIMQSKKYNPVKCQTEAPDGVGKMSFVDRFPSGAQLTPVGV